MEEIKIIFFETDASFDYCGGTYRQTDEHGFKIEIEKKTPKIETLEGFGAFEDVERCKNCVNLFCYIEENKKYLKDEQNRLKQSINLRHLNKLKKLLRANINSELKRAAIG